MTTNGAGSASYPSLARARIAQAVLASIGLFSAMDAGVVALLIEPMKRELKLSDFQIGLANTTMFYAAYGLLCTPMGMLTDRLSRVRLLILAMVLWCGGLALTGLSHALWLLMISKVIMGAANAMTYPAAMSLLSDYFAPDHRAFATATYGMGQTIGGAGAVLLGGLGYSALVRLAESDPNALFGLTPWRVVALLFGAIGVLLIPFLLAMREPGRMEVAEKSGGTLRELWAYRRFLAPLFGGMMCLAGLSSGVGFWLAPALMRLYGQQPGAFAGWFSTVGLVTGIVGALTSGKLAEVARRRRGPEAVMLPAAIAAVLCVPASFVAVMPDVPWFAVAVTALMLSAGVAMMIPVIAINFRMPNELRGFTIGLYVILIALANALAGPLVAVVSRALGGDAMLGWAMAAVGTPLALLTALCFWIASRTRGGGETPSTITNFVTL